MIFSKSGHIQQIINGMKTQTRRPSARYAVNKIYAIQPGKGKKGITEGKIKILLKWKETSWYLDPLSRISSQDAKAEGGYTSDDYEHLYSAMYPNWAIRWTYAFKFIPTSPRNG